jgi:hypothetical protein
MRKFNSFEKSIVEKLITESENGYGFVSVVNLLNKYFMVNRVINFSFEDKQITIQYDREKDSNAPSEIFSTIFFIEELLSKNLLLGIKDRNASIGKTFLSTNFKLVEPKNGSYYFERIPKLKHKYNYPKHGLTFLSSYHKTFKKILPLSLYVNQELKTYKEEKFKSIDLKVLSTAKFQTYVTLIAILISSLSLVISLNQVTSKNSNQLKVDNSQKSEPIKKHYFNSKDSITLKK